MKDKILALVSILLSVTALTYTAWLHNHTEALVQQSLKAREREFVQTLAPKIQEVYSGFGITNNVGNPTTLDQLFGPYLDIINRMATPPTDAKEPR